MHYSNQLNEMLNTFKALSDETRLKLLSVLKDGEHTVRDLAQHFELSEPTMSHHLSKLRAIGWLNLRQDGNKRYYRINHKQVNNFKQNVQNLDNLLVEDDEPRDLSWLESLPLTNEEKKIIQHITDDRRLRGYPVKMKKQLVVLKWMATLFEDDVIYSEQEVNEIIQPVYHDYMIIRRNLIEMGYMKRERDGKRYWMTPQHAPQALENS